jgi:23S rRNA (adenine2503-C2)-methyltransferase
MNEKIVILSHTCESFSLEIARRLGKGERHARLIYEEWFRTGQVSGKNPAFNNAQKLYQDILDLTDFSYLSLSNKHHDGATGKVLLQTRDHLEIEAVLIPMRAGGTLCVSSQVGCKMGCSFCETGRMGLLRNLTAAEIVSQLFVARFILNFSVRNIVFMGMGEPFDNYDSVMQAFRIMIDPHGFGFGPNHITISTSGRIDGIQKLMQEKGAIPNLAVSINAPNDVLRNTLMPVNRQYPLSDLYQVMDQFCRTTKKEILIAYVLLKDRNDSLEHAQELANYLKGLSVRINLIPYNRQSHDRYESSEREHIDLFATVLRKAGYNCLIRQTKGDKIMAACGQLGNLKLKQLRKRPLQILPILPIGLAK